MDATLKLNQPTYRRRAAFAVSGVPPATHSDYFPLQANQVSVDISRDGEHARWEIAWVSISGPRIRADETVGTKHTEHLYSAKSVHTAPDWALSLANGYLMVSEVDRQGRKLRPADVRDNPGYFISGPGLALAQAAHCGHGYTLVDTCPGCDYDEEHGTAPYGSCKKWASNRACARPLDKFGFCDRQSDHTD